MDAQRPDDTRYVLITQCLQNDLFMNRSCRLFLPDHVARTVLLGKKDYDFDQGTGSRRHLPAKVLERGPLGIFLASAIGERMKGGGHGVLHVINIRDWHEPDDSYDFERRSYGAHCEAGTWGAEYIDGLDRYLDPGDSPADGEAAYFENGTVRIYHVHSDSLFDFKPRAAQIDARNRKFTAAALEDVLDVIVQGSDEDVERMRQILRAEPRLSAIHDFAREVDADQAIRSAARVYAGVIGVYTDLKVKTLLAGLRTRYNLTNLALSDTFTASVTLERHLAGLDFAKKVLNVEVIHGIGDFVRFLGGTRGPEDESEIVSADAFSRYQSFFQDQQNVLAYEHERLQEYLLLTERRAVKVYDTVNRSNRFLIAWGAAFLMTTLVFSILSAVWPRTFDWKVPAITAGVSLAQFLGAFFTAPTEDLQRNLTNLAVFKMILESHSLKTAFARYHLTTPQTLRELQTDDEAASASRQIDSLQKQLAVIQQFVRDDFDGLQQLGFRADRAAAAVAATDAVTPVPTDPTPVPVAALGDGQGNGTPPAT